MEGRRRGAKVADPTGYNTGVRGSAQHSVGEPPQARTPFGARRRADRPATVMVPRGAHTLPELGDDHTGTYVWDYIGRGCYCATLEHYGNSEAKKSDTPWHRLRPRGY